jgi:hypothetical protein
MITNYIESKIDNKKYCKINGHFTRHLKNNGLTYKEYYESYVTKYTPLCECLRPLTFTQSDESYAGSCGDPICVGKNVSITKQNWTEEQRQQDSKNKSKANLQRTEKEIQLQKQKTIETNRRKYGVDWSTQSENNIKKSKKTKLEKYGDEFYNNNEKTSESWQAMSRDKISAIVDKRRKTNLGRFGVESAFMKPGVLEKSAKSNARGKEFIMPSGKVVGIRGHEDIVLTELLKTYDENDLVIDDRSRSYELPIFEYISHEQRRLKYYPDIHILSQNKIIEVKSRWWWDAGGRDGYEGRLSNNIQKRKSVLSAGYNYEVWLFEDKNNYRILSNDCDFA